MAFENCGVCEGTKLLVSSSEATTTTTTAIKIPVAGPHATTPSSLKCAESDALRFKFRPTI